MRTLVTGASGFIGSHVSRSLLQAGHEVLALAPPDDNLWRLRDILPHISVIRGTLQDISSVQKEIRERKPDVCVHFAWYAEPGKYLNGQENIDSLHGSINLLKELAKNGCEHFIGAGTCAEYEQKPEALMETDRTKPENLYAASKLALQLVGQQLAALFGIRFAWGRIFYLYGDQEDPRRLVPDAIRKLQNGVIFSASPGEQIRDYLHVADVANAFLFMLEKQAEGIINICSAEPITVKDLLSTIGELIGKPELLACGSLPYRDWEPMFVCGRNDRLRSLGWSPRFDLRTGLRETIDWWKHVYGNS